MTGKSEKYFIKHVKNVNFIMFFELDFLINLEL